VALFSKIRKISKGLAQHPLPYSNNHYSLFKPYMEKTSCKLIVEISTLQQLMLMAISIRGVEEQLPITRANVVMDIQT